jgi:hypothetical protein
MIPHLCLDTLSLERRVSSARTRQRKCYYAIAWDGVLQPSEADDNASALSFRFVSWARFHTFFEFFEVDSIQGGGGKKILLLLKSLAFASPFLNNIYMARNYSRRGLTILKASPNYSVPEMQPFILLKENLHLHLGMMQWQPMFETTNSLEAKKPLLLPK